MNTSDGDFAVKTAFGPGLMEQFTDVYNKLRDSFPPDQFPYLLPQQWVVKSEFEGLEKAAIVQRWVNGKPLGKITVSDFQYNPHLADELDAFLRIARKMDSKPDILSSDDILTSDQGHAVLIATDVLLPWGEKGRHMAGVIRSLINAANDGQPISYTKAFNDLYKQTYLNQPLGQLLRRAIDRRMTR